MCVPMYTYEICLSVCFRFPDNTHEQTKTHIKLPIRPDRLNAERHSYPYIPPGVPAVYGRGVRCLQCCILHQRRRGT